MKRLIIAGFGQPILDLIGFFENRFEIIGVILDYERKSKFPAFYEYLEVNEISIYSFEDVCILQPDAVIVINYNKIIDISNIQIPFLLNIHMGILPVYRGNNANAASILNGDRKVGYTLHQVCEVLDGGEIYYKFGYEIKAGETYFHAKTAISENMKVNLPGVIDDVLDKKIIGVSQDKEEFIYASKLYPEDGVLCNWNYTTEEIINRFMVFARPLGSGLKMIYKTQELEISRFSVVPGFKISNGFPGAVILKNPNGSVWVKTKDTAISIDEIYVDGRLVLPGTLFKIGERL